MNIMQGMYGGHAAAIAAANLMRSARMPRPEVVTPVEPVRTPIAVPAEAVIVPIRRRAGSRRRAPKFEKAIAFLRDNPEAPREVMIEVCGISTTYADEVRAKLGLPSRRECRKQALLQEVRENKDFNAAAYAKKTRISTYVVYAMLRELLADKTVQRVIRYEVVNA